MDETTYTLNEIRRLLDPDRADWAEFSRHSVPVIEFLLRRVESLEQAPALNGKAVVLMLQAKDEHVPYGVFTTPLAAKSYAENSMAPGIQLTWSEYGLPRADVGDGAWHLVTVEVDPRIERKVPDELA